MVVEIGRDERSALILQLSSATLEIFLPIHAVESWLVYPFGWANERRPRNPMEPCFLQDSPQGPVCLRHRQVQRPR